MRFSLPFKLLASYLVVLAVIVVPSVLLLRSELIKSLELLEARELQNHVEELRDRLEHVAEADLDRVARDYAQLTRFRITIARADGTVLVDSEVLPAAVAALENHSNRPEIKTASSGVYGYAVRPSATVGKNLIYGALPLRSGPLSGGVLRVSTPAAPVAGAVTEALIDQRVPAGLGLSAAIALSFLSALYISSPLRRMRDVVVAFSHSRWQPVPRVNSRDEIEDLSVALDELGRKLGEQLIEVGAQDTLLAQAVRAIPTPALVLSPSLEPMHVNGAFRRFAAITAADEAERLAAVALSKRLIAAVAEAEKTGLATEMSLSSLSDAAESERALLVPLMRASGKPLWLLLAGLDGSDAENHEPEALHRLLHGAQKIVAALWTEHASLHPKLAELQRRLDETAEAAGVPHAVSVEPLRVDDLVRRSVDEVRALLPKIAPRIEHDVVSSAGPNELHCFVAESAGLAARALRSFIGAAARSLPLGRSLQVSLRAEASQAIITLEGAVPSDIERIRRLVQGLGGDAGLVASREREAAWLSLPRA